VEEKPGAGLALWLTGLPASGKTTLAVALAADLAARGRRVEVLDGDDLRKTVSADLGFSRADRDEHVRRVAALARDRVQAGVVAIVALVSPYRQAREQARLLIGEFVEIHVSCPLPVALERDPKGLYRRALAGEIDNFTGVSDPYEAPLAADVMVDTSSESVATSKQRVLAHLERRGYLPPA
jgi:adenylyl-sulfate kinase